MRSIIMSIFLLLNMLTSIQLRAENKEPLSVNVELINKSVFKDPIYNTCCDNISEYIDKVDYEIKIEITNNKDTLVSVVMMTCSWMDNFITSNPLLFLSDVDCDSNYPHFEYFKAHEKREFKTNLVALTDDESFTTKVGFIMIQSNEIYFNIDNYLNIMRDRSVWKIVWSNPIELTK